MAVPDVGPLEMRVLGLLSSAEPQSVSAVQLQLTAQGQKLAYTTVMTVLKRLHDKGLVLRAKQSRRYVYGVGRRSAQAKEGIMARVRHALFQSDRLRPVVALLEEEDLSRDELRALREAIDAKLKETNES